MMNGMMKTWVVWDVNSCPVPVDCDPRLVRPCIESALKKQGCSGQLTITAVGNLKHTLKQTPDVLRTIYSTGILLEHVPEGFGDIFEKLWIWTWDNPPPANLMLITGDEDVKDYYWPLLNLLCSGYFIFVAYPRLVFSKLVATPEEYSFYMVYVKKDVWETLLKGVCTLSLSLSTTPDEPQETCCKTVETNWVCTLCKLDGCGIFEDFIMHLKSRKHAVALIIRTLVDDKTWKERSFEEEG